MNKYVYFVIGLAVGSGISAFVTNKIATKKAQQFADKQIEDTKTSLKNYYDKRIESIQKENTESQELKNVREEKGEQLSIDLGVDPGINDEPKKQVEDPRSRFPESSKTIQSRVSDVMKRPKDLPPTAIDTLDGYPDPEDRKAPPYLIREEDFGELDDWDTLELIFWKCGTVTTDDSVCEVVSPTLLFKLLPEKWPDMFGWGDEHKYDDQLFFRNNAEKRDIQISKDMRTYKEWLEEVYPNRLDEIEEG